MNKFFAIIIAAIMSTTYVFAISSTKCKNECMVNRFMNLNKNSDWKLIKKITLQFPSYHVQGMVKIGKYFYISSARITEKSERLKDSDYGYDRTPGKGVGYLFKFDINGKLIDKITLGIKDCYHPGGIDFDGKYIWVPVSEYRPNSRSIIYRVDPTTMKAEEIFRFGDHIGTISYNPETGILYGSSWGSRRWYAWKLKPENYLNQSKKEFNIPPYTMKLNSEHYIDYQDTHFIPGHYILCGGLNVYPIKNTGDTALKIHTEKHLTSRKYIH